jgi:hypothetical protein
MMLETVGCMTCPFCRNKPNNIPKTFEELVLVYQDLAFYHDVQTLTTLNIHVEDYLKITMNMSPEMERELIDQNVDEPFVLLS